MNSDLGEMLTELETPAEETLVEGDKEVKTEVDVETEVLAEKLPVGYEPPEGEVEKPAVIAETEIKSEKGEEPPDVNKTVASMQEQMEQLTTAMTALTTHVAEGKKGEAAPEMPAFDYTESEFVLTDDKFDAMMKTPAAFNDTMNAVAEYAAAKAVEHFNTVMPGLVGSEALRAADNTLLVRLFWRDNRDITKLPDAKIKVAQAYRELEATNPGRSPEDLFELLGPAVRRKHALKTPDVGKDRKKEKAVHAPVGSANRATKVAPERMSIAEEITKMETL